MIGAVGIADEFAHLRGDLVAGHQGRVGAEFPGEGEALFINVDGDDKPRALELEGLDDEESDEPGSDNDGGITGFRGSRLTPWRRWRRVRRRRRVRKADRRDR